MTDTDRRRDRWQRFSPYDMNLHLVVPEIADDMDELERLAQSINERMAKLVGISASLLIAVCTGLILALAGKI